jgi:hypothetical protein
MKSREGMVVFFVLALALLASACEPVSVAPWPYTTEAADAAPADGGASNNGASNDASDQGMSGAGGIQANYAPAPLRCDGGLCDTDNYSLCNVADKSAGGGAATAAFSLLAVIAAIAVARKRSRGKARRSS